MTDTTTEPTAPTVEPEPHPYPRVARVQCMNPPCPEYTVVKEVGLPHLGDGVYLGTDTITPFLCGHCGNPAPMNRLFGTLPTGSPESLGA